MPISLKPTKVAGYYNGGSNFGVAWETATHEFRMRLAIDYSPSGDYAFRRKLGEPNSTRHKAIDILAACNRPMIAEVCRIAKERDVITEAKIAAEAEEAAETAAATARDAGKMRKTIAKLLREHRARAIGFERQRLFRDRAVEQRACRALIELRDLPDGLLVGTIEGIAKIN